MSAPIHFETKFPSNTSEGLKVQNQIVSLMETFNYSMRDIFAMRLSLEESLTNAIRHGNKLDPTKFVEVDCRIDDERMVVVVRDEGDGFQPEDVPDPTLEEFLECPGGRGLMLMRAYLNTCDYSEGGRCIRMERERNSPLPILED
jgi:serine/threonine-protein kinase RsbW